MRTSLFAFLAKGGTVHLNSEKTESQPVTLFYQNMTVTVTTKVEAINFIQNTTQVSSSKIKTRC